MLPSRVLIAAQIEARAGSIRSIIEGAETGYASAQADDVVSFPIASLSERARSQQPVTSPKGGFLLPIFSAENDQVFLEMCSEVADGPRVRVLSTYCHGCEQEIWLDDREGGTYTVAAAVLRLIAQQWHTENCPGPLFFETEPA